MGSGKSNDLSICAVRFTRCTSDGSPISSNPHGAVCLVGGIGTAKWTADIIAGDKIRDIDGCGGLAVNRRYRNRLAGFDLELDFLAQSHEMREVAYGAALLLDEDSEIIGHADIVDTACGTAADQNGVIVEVWGENWRCTAAAPNPYRRVAFARAFFDPSDGNMARGTNHLVLKGYAEANPNFGDGPFNDLDAALDLDPGWIRAAFDDDALPTPSVDGGYIATPSQT